MKRQLKDSIKFILVIMQIVWFFIFTLNIETKSADIILKTISGTIFILNTDILIRHTNLFKEGIF